MIQDQIVEYINTQMKLGVSRETIKNTLVTAGWQAADVEDTLKKVEAAKMSQPITQPPASTSAKPIAPTSTIKSDSQTMRVSDLISASDPMMSAKPSMPSSASMPVSTPSAKAASAFPPSKITTTKQTVTEFPARHSSHGAVITEVVLGILVIALGAFAGFLYFENSGLSGQVKSLTTQSAGVTSQLSTLQEQINASTTALTAETQSLTGESQELQAELSFYAMPPNATAGVAVAETVSGTVSGGGKTPYLITATYGAKIYITNSKDAGVIAALTPLEASSTVAQFSGTSIPTSDSFTLTSVNGTSFQ